MPDDAGSGQKPPKRKVKAVTPLIPKLPACGFLVEGTKNGGWPIRTEKRSYKKVTVIDNVSGAADVLCREIRTKMGTGAGVRMEVIEGHRKLTVEVQGDGHTERLKKLLREFGCTKGIALTEAEKKDAEARAEVCEPARVRLKPRHKKEDEEEKLEVPKIAPCWQWHKFYPYCQGRCERDISFADVWANVLDARDEEWIEAQRKKHGDDGKKMTIVELDKGLRTFGMLAEPVSAEDYVRKVDRNRKNFKVAALTPPRKASIASSVENKGGWLTKTAFTRPKAKPKAKPAFAKVALNKTLEHASNWVCDICQAQFAAKKTLATHKKRAHGGGGGGVWSAQATGNKLAGWDVDDDGNYWDYDDYDDDHDDYDHQTGLPKASKSKSKKKTNLAAYIPGLDTQGWSAKENYAWDGEYEEQWEDPTGFGKFGVTENNSNKMSSSNNLLICPSCDGQFTYAEIDAHYEKCSQEKFLCKEIDPELAVANCRICADPVPVAGMNAHIRDVHNGSQCEICSGWFSDAEFDTHIIGCLEAMQNVNASASSKLPTPKFSNPNVFAGQKLAQEAGELLWTSTEEEEAAPSSEDDIAKAIRLSNEEAERKKEEEELLQRIMDLSLDEQGNRKEYDPNEISQDDLEMLEAAEFSTYRSALFWSFVERYMDDGARACDAFLWSLQHAQNKDDHPSESDDEEKEKSGWTGPKYENNNMNDQHEEYQSAHSDSDDGFWDAPAQPAASGSKDINPAASSSHQNNDRYWETDEHVKKDKSKDTEYRYWEDGAGARYGYRDDCRTGSYGSREAKRSSRDREHDDSKRNRDRERDRNRDRIPVYKYSRHDFEDDVDYVKHYDKWRRKKLGEKRDYIAFYDDSDFSDDSDGHYLRKEMKRVKELRKRDEEHISEFDRKKDRRHRDHRDDDYSKRHRDRDKHREEPPPRPIRPRSESPKSNSEEDPEDKIIRFIQSETRQLYEYYKEKPFKGGNAALSQYAWELMKANSYRQALTIVQDFLGQDGKPRKSLRNFVDKFAEMKNLR